MMDGQNLSGEINHFLKSHALLPTTIAADSEVVDQVIELVVAKLAEVSRQVDGREVVWNAAHQTDAAQVIQEPARVHNATVSSHGNDLMKSLLEDRYHGTVHSLATDTGIDASEVTRLVGQVGLVAAGLLGQKADANQWDADALSQWLQEQRGGQPQVQRTVRPALPPLPAFTATPREPVAARSGGSSHWGWIALLVAVAIASFLLGRQTAPAINYQLPDTALASNALSAKDRFSLPTAATDNRTTWDAANPINVTTNENFQAAGGYPTVIATNTTPNSGGGYVYGNAGVPVVLKLSGGLQQIIGSNSTESRLYQFLADPTMEVDTLNPLKGWIGFDRIYFESSKATLTNESMWQLSNVASILKTFPRAEVRIGGYTDSSGDPLFNLRLSRDRAQAARATLISMGVDPNNVEAIGYGSLDNIASNDTPDGRSLNRRVSIRVLEK
ncbi:OmpA family protein [Hymenobacter aerilatus]|uniref:OmpA family protein n=1 Tax=Hymenobacter aerilatus TaxID=2932251 RepID=A0A8T9T1K8_9BACT|nr:OmpA family protein [Hymenobacter aerilatus]UOR05889.1 OmpA family protein [Hymenobacter aerilatus]